jgi:hypothetical protein
VTQSNDDPSAIHAFAEAAQAFCDLLDTPPEPEDADGARLMLALATLHLGVLRIPHVFDEDATEVAYERRPLRCLREWVDCVSVHLYYTLFDPLTALPEEPGAGDMEDDLADIHRDIEEGLAAYRAGRLLEAGWLWRFSFYSHWGRHLTDVQRALHCAKCSDAAEPRS